jgi:hypothetical protein
MAKVVFNNRVGAFGLSNAALKRMLELGSTYVKENPNYNAPNEFGDGTVVKWWEDKYIFDWDCPRHDDILVKVVGELGELANGHEATLQLADVVSKYIIMDSRGWEQVVQPQDIQWQIASNRF